VCDVYIYGVCVYVCVCACGVGGKGGHGQMQTISNTLSYLHDTYLTLFLQEHSLPDSGV